MRSRLAHYFQEVRRNRGLSLSQVARLIGYGNLSKGCNKVQKFEDRGEIHADLLQKLANVLEIDDDTIETLIDQDRREYVVRWNAWASEPIKPQVVVRLMPAAYLHKDLPEEVTSAEEAEAFAAEIAREWSKKVCLVWTRRVSVWFDEDGTLQGRKEAVPGGTNVPTMRLSGNRRTFMLEEPSNGQPFLRLSGWLP